MKLRNLFKRKPVKFEIIKARATVLDPKKKYIIQVPTMRPAAIEMFAKTINKFSNSQVLVLRFDKPLKITELPKKRKIIHMVEWKYDSIRKRKLRYLLSELVVLLKANILKTGMK